MGGTSTDVALIRGGIPEVSSELTIDYGLPIHVPMVDVRTRRRRRRLDRLDQRRRHAAGRAGIGRLVARPDLLRPRRHAPDHHRRASAARPARSGAARPASTARRRSSRCARRSREQIAAPLGLSPEDAAAAILRLANTHMAGAIRMVSLSRGYDPRDFVLFAFGGAGPLHAVAIARELGLPEVVVPARPGLTNALGCLVADLRQDFVNTINAPLDALDMRVVAETLRAQRAEGERINAAEQDEIVETVVLHGADMQFRGQTHLIRIAIPSPDVTREDAAGAVRGGLFRALPGAAAGDPRGAGQPGHVGDRPAAEPSVAALAGGGRGGAGARAAARPLYVGRRVARGARLRARAACAGCARSKARRSSSSSTRRR